MIDIWTIYQSPADYPGKFVARRWVLDQPTADVFVCDSLAEVRARLPRGLHRLDRKPDDDAVIVETWI